jgi:hypothetical protein
MNVNVHDFLCALCMSVAVDPGASDMIKQLHDVGLRKNAKVAKPHRIAQGCTFHC